VVVAAVVIAVALVAVFLKEGALGCRHKDPAAVGGIVGPAGITASTRGEELRSAIHHRRQELHTGAVRSAIVIAPVPQVLLGNLAVQIVTIVFVRLSASH
jgi:hypothetical protein